MLPADRDAWAKEQAEVLIAGLARVRIRSRRRSRRAPAPACRRAGRGSRRPAGRAGARRRGAGRGGAGGQPVPQGVPRGQAARTGAGRAGWSGGWSWASAPGRGSSGLVRELSSRHLRPCAGCASWPGGNSSGPGPGDVPSMPEAGGRPAARPRPPRVIAVVVTYNRRQLLLEALAAVHSQSRAPDAVIVVDNASTDQTAAAVRAQFPVGAAGRAGAQHRRRGRVRLRHGAGPGRRRGSDLAHGRRHGARAGRAAGAAARPGLQPGPAARADRQQRAVDRRARAPDEHPADQAAGHQGRAGRRRGRRVPADPVRVVRVDPRRCRRVPPPRPARRRTTSCGTTTSSSRPGCCAATPAAVPGERRRAQDADVRLDRRRPGAALLLRGPEQDLDAAEPARRSARWSASCTAGSTLRRWARTFARSRDRRTLGPHSSAASPPGCAPARGRTRRSSPRSASRRGPRRRRAAQHARLARG